MWAWPSAQAGIPFVSDTQAALGSPLQGAVELASSTRFAGVAHAPRSPCYSFRGNDGHLFFEIGFMQSPWVSLRLKSYFQNTV